MQNRIKSIKGFVFTFEAIIALLLFALMLYSIHPQKNSNLEELIIIQQSNDLLRVWSQNYPSEEEILFDTKAVFENNAGVKINEKELTTCTGKDKLVTEGIMLNDLLIEDKITLIVCYD